MPDSSRKRTVRLPLVLSKRELQAIDEYRFQYRLPNRSAAVRALLQTGIAWKDKDGDAAN
jgi:hypothetical protein